MSETLKSVLIWGTIALAISILMVTKNSSAMVLSASFMLKLWAVIVGTLIGLGGALAGDAIRRFALPAGFFTTGGMTSILRMRIFWAVGPQSIGVLLGVILGVSWVLS